MAFRKRVHKAVNARRKSARSMQYRANRGAQNYRVMRNLRSQVHGSEMKSVDISWANGGGSAPLAINATAVITPVNLIQAGSSFTNRVGRRVEMVSLHLTGGVTMIANRTTLANDFARILVVYDRQPNGAVPTIATMFASYDQTTTPTTTVTSGLNPDERERFQILADQRMILPPQDVASAGVTPANYGPIEGNKDVFLVNRFIKLRSLATHYKADSSPAVMGDIATGALYIVTWGSINAGSEAYQYHHEARLRYKDT